MIVPSERPKLAHRLATEMLRIGGVDTTKPALLGRRGYYRDLMGYVGRNDNGIYDDAIFIVSPDLFRPFNANTDPSRVYKRVATLRPGRYLYQIGIHGLSKPKDRQYRALVQATPVTVDRFEGPTETGFFGINIHRGGVNTTSSEGCQTIYPTQWEEFMNLVQQGLRKHNLRTIPYLLNIR